MPWNLGRCGGTIALMGATIELTDGVRADGDVVLFVSPEARAYSGSR